MAVAKLSSRRMQTDATVSSGLDFGEFGDLLGYQLRRAQAAVHRDFTGSVAGLDLTQKQAATLWLIQINPGASQVAVANALGMDRPTMMAVTDRLELRGLVTRVRSTIDRRCQELHLTPAGKALLAKLKKRIAQHEARIRELFTRRELDAFVATLQKLQELA